MSHLRRPFADAGEFVPRGLPFLEEEVLLLAEGRLLGVELFAASRDLGGDQTLPLAGEFVFAPPPLALQPGDVGLRGGKVSPELLQPGRGPREVGGRVGPEPGTPPGRAPNPPALAGFRSGAR